LPKSFRWLTKSVRVDRFLLTHEIVEKALLDELRLHYLHAHQVATRALDMFRLLTGSKATKSSPEGRTANPSM
jgi:hypothetical protein